MAVRSIKISGPAGGGVMQAGETLSKALNRLGFSSLVYPEYPSRIRGGDNNVQLLFSAARIGFPQRRIDLLVAFDQKLLADHRAELGRAGLSFDISFLKSAVKHLNAATLGFLWAVMGGEICVLEDQLKEDFPDQAVFRANLQDLEVGFKKGLALGASGSPAGAWLRSRPGKNAALVNLTGNEALTEGVLAAGCAFAAIYPMTPINSVLTQLAQRQITLFKPEDEISGIMAALGAAYTGARSLVATSGGGFSLMVEGLGMAGMAEIPLVIILGQRTGPSSGVPTYSSQADLSFAINAGHGEFPRIVLTPGDLPELFNLGAAAFDLAERYQTPVIVLTDKYLAESRFSESEKGIKQAEHKLDRGKLWTGKDRAPYQRYRLTKDGVSPRAFPGQTTFLTNSYEHDQAGRSIDDAPTRQRMMAKRDKKLLSLGRGTSFYGQFEAKTLLVGWGSTKTGLLKQVEADPSMALLHFWRVWPFPAEASACLRKFKRVLVVEANYSGQLASLIEKAVGGKVRRITKDDGRPFFQEELELAIRKDAK